MWTKTLHPLAEQFNKVAQHLSFTQKVSARPRMPSPVYEVRVFWDVASFKRAAKIIGAFVLKITVMDRRATFIVNNWQKCFWQEKNTFHELFTVKLAFL